MSDAYICHVHVDGRCTKYMIDDRGRIYYCKANRYLRKKTFIAAGYEYVRLQFGKHFKNFRVHRLVAEHFIDTIPKGHEVNHIDGNKLNNDVRNLEICSKKQNQLHQVTTHNARPRGASYRKDRRLWRSTITISDSGKKRQEFLGFYESKRDAQNAFYKRFIEIHGVAPWQK